LGDYVGRHKVCIDRADVAEVVELAALGPCIPRDVGSRFTFSVVPLNRAGYECKREDTGMRMPPGVTARRIRDILNENSRRSIGSKVCSELVATCSEDPISFDVGVVISCRQNGCRETKDWRGPRESKDGATDCYGS